MLLIPDIRLANGTGRLEVEQDGIWGTVCSIGWSSDASVTACRQLGFYTGHRLDMTCMSMSSDALHPPIHYQGNSSTITCIIKY